MGKIGASGETRTLKMLPSVDFESTASTDSATLAQVRTLRAKIFLFQSFLFGCSGFCAAFDKGTELF